LKRGDTLTLTIEDYAFEGKGIARVRSADNPDKKYVIFVERAYPGDKVEAQIYRKKKSFAEAKVINVLEASPERTEARCSHFGICGGCRQQDLKYETQIRYKREQVRDIFERIGGITDFKLEDIIGSDQIYYFRNKLEFSFSDRRWLTPDEISNNNDIPDRNFALGFHIPRIYDKVLNITECFLLSETSNDILNYTRNFFQVRNATIYSTKTHEGYLRNLVIRHSHHTNDLMVNLVTSEDKPELITEYAEELSCSVKGITTIVNNINTKKAQVSTGDYEKVYSGDGHIFDEIAGFRYRISANSFFQTNTLQAEKLYQAVLDYADFKGDEVVYDLYSGAGTISIFIARNVKEVHAFESVESAVKDAIINSESNSVYNVHFHTADLNKSFSYLVKEQGIPKPDVVILDPPRGGMNPKTVRDILRLLPQRVLYISCNPATQARDIKLLCDEQYKLVKMKPVDMFPHTYHIENVAKLVRR
jgi:23S rRNA (uracil1939-C5)-methyltransferase